MTSSLIFPPSNFQLQSPLFGILPGEIRNDIFKLALMQYEDDAAAYPEDSYWYRPGFSGPLKGSSALLRTCRLAYAEGQKVFLRELELAFWFDRGPHGRTSTPACEKFFRDLTPHAVQALQKVRFFTQMIWLENGLNLFYLFSIPQFRPTQLTITIRYSDWRLWEVDQPLRMNEGWLRYFEGNPGLRVLKVEYETLIRKKAEMMRIIKRNKKWKLPVSREGGSFQANDLEGYLSAQGTALQEWKWKGTSKLGGQRWSHLGTGDKVDYVVVTDTWRFVEAELSKHEMEGRMKSMARAPETIQGMTSRPWEPGAWCARLRESGNVPGAAA